MESTSPRRSPAAFDWRLIRRTVRRPGAAPGVNLKGGMGTISDITGAESKPLFGLLVAMVLLLAGCASHVIPEHGTRPTFMQEPASPHIRVMSYNVGWDSIFQKTGLLNGLWSGDSRAAAFVRIIRAIDPDVICLQEIDPARDPQQVADILNAAVPLADGKTWQVYSGQDDVIAARFELVMRAQQLAHHGTTLNFGHAMALVDLPDLDYPADLYLVCAHFQALAGQENVEARQKHADMIVGWIRDIRTPGGEIDLPTNTPLVVLGDLNVYDTDPAHHLTTLLTGDIVDERGFGPDIAPDWDGTALADALPHHNGDGQDVYTWRDDTTDFNPGVLDRILYTDSVVTASNGFVLNTTIMTEAELGEAGLRPGDVMLKPDEGLYDHLPLVVDIEFRHAAGQDQ
jgi:endonuclease/exonuclease/phosphatase family metal-dependent hydrolase